MEQPEQEPKKRSFRERFLRPIVIPALAVFTALLIGALVIIFTAENPLVGLEKVGVGYWGIIDGALLSTRGLTNTLVAMTPLILTGLAVAIPFRAGLFNIGGEGQFTIGALFGALAGIYLNLPPGIHVLVTLLAGFAGGMILGFIPGVLKAWLGSHEVINTIMLNYIALFVANMVVREFIRDPKPSTLQSLPLQESAWLPHLTGRLHLGFFVAILMAVLAWFFLFKTTWGFSLRTTGQNPSAASYAGIRPKLEYVLAMVLGGGLAALAGTIEVQGLSHVLTSGYAFGYGFDGIAVSLLALNHPLAIIPAAFIFAVLRIGGDYLQIRAGLSVHIVSILQALILLFVAAPAIIRYIYRLKETYRAGEEGGPLTTGWGS
ncbi:MAG: ABC transporter permease [Candidatus Promineifilaceae bacterium]